MKGFFRHLSPPLQKINPFLVFVYNNKILIRLEIFCSMVGIIISFASVFFCFNPPTMIK